MKIKPENKLIKKMVTISKRLDKNFKRPFSESDKDSIEYWHHYYANQLEILSWVTGISKNKFVQSKSA